MYAGPYPPLVTVDESYSHSSLPTYTIRTSVIGIPLWPGYEISEFKMNITSNSLLNQTVILNNQSESDTVHFVQILDPSLTLDCTTLKISVSAVSVTYGESDITQIDTKVLKSKISAIIIISIASHNLDIMNNKVMCMHAIKLL